MPEVNVEAKCPECGKIDRFQIPSECLEARSRGLTVDQACAELPPERRKQLVDGTCLNCQLAKNS